MNALKRPAWPLPIRTTPIRFNLHMLQSFPLSDQSPILAQLFCLAKRRVNSVLIQKKEKEETNILGNDQKGRLKAVQLTVNTKASNRVRTDLSFAWAGHCPKRKETKRKENEGGTGRDGTGTARIYKGVSIRGQFHSFFSPFAAWLSSGNACD